MERITRRMAGARAVALVGIAAALGACELIAGIEDTELEVHAVRGVAAGLLEPVSVRLEHTGGSELLTVLDNGPFVFEARLGHGASFVVSFAGAAPCVLGNDRGVIMGADAEVLVVCESVLLEGLALSGPTAPDLGFAPGGLSYDAGVSLMQQSTRITATAMHAEASLAIAGMPADSGVPGPELALALGENAIEVTVSHPRGGALTYRVTVNRAADVAQYAYGKASNTGAGDMFGFSVALSGDTLAVGAWGEDSAATGVNGNQADSSAWNSGAVYVFRRSGTAWAQEAYIKASNTGAGDLFGRSVALSGDTLAVGAPEEDSAATGVNGNQADNSAQDSGAVYVFRRSGTTWAQEAYLKASNTGAFDWFGTSVALSGDTLAVGASGEDSAATGVGGNQADNTATDSGAAYVFRRSGTSWAQEAYVKASNTDAYDYFGGRVALSGDTLAVGAAREDSAATGVNGDEADNSAENSGAAYVFRRSGTTWAQEAYVKASNTGDEHRFGFSVALSGDTLAVGALWESSAATGVNGDEADSSAEHSGAVYVFRRSGTTWAQEAYVKASNTEAGDHFGTSVALSGDALAVGARHEASAATGVNGDQADNAASGSGAVYVFRHIGATWAQESYIKASNTGAGDWFGYSVTLSGDTLAVGAYRENSAATGVNGDQADSSATESGAVYMFH